MVATRRHDDIGFVGGLFELPDDLLELEVGAGEVEDAGGVLLIKVGGSAISEGGNGGTLARRGSSIKGRGSCRCLWGFVTGSSSGCPASGLQRSCSRFGLGMGRMGRLRGDRPTRAPFALLLCRYRCGSVPASLCFLVGRLRDYLGGTF